jgi:HK97 family phage portal protein
MANPIKAVTNWLSGVQRVTVEQLWRAYNSDSLDKPMEFSAELALQMNAVWACVNLLASTISTLQLDVYRKTGKGKDEYADQHPVYQLFRRMPNKCQTTGEFLQTMTMHMLLTGRAVAQVVRVGKGKPYEIIPIDPSKVVVKLKKAKVEGFHEYELEYYLNNSETPTPSEQILDLKGASLDGVTPLSPIGMQRQTLSTGYSMTNYNQSIYEKGVTLSGVVEMPEKISPEGYERFQQSLEEFKGSKNAGKILQLGNGSTFKSVSMNMVDAQFLETMKFNRGQIASIFRVPSHMINDLDKSSFNNIQHQSREFLMYTLLPHLIRWEQTLNATLFSPEEQGQYYVKFNVDDFSRADMGERIDSLTKGIAGGLYTPNDAREAEGLAPSPSPNANKLHIPLNIAPIGETQANEPRQANPQQ